MRRVWLWRHGQTDYNAELRVQGQVDIPLNSVGIAQAAAGARALDRSLGDRPIVIVSSTLGRARNTARALADLRRVPVTHDDRLQERAFGPWEGKTRDEMVADWPEEYEVWRAGGDPEGIGVETKRAVAERMCRAIGEHTDALADGAGLVIVSHGSALNQAVCAMLGTEQSGKSRIRGLDNCHWSEIQRFPSGEWVLRAHNLGA